MSKLLKKKYFVISMIVINLFSGLETFIFTFLYADGISISIGLTDERSYVE